MDRLLRLVDAEGPRRGSGRAGGRDALIAGPVLSVALVGYGYSAATFHVPLIGATAGLRLTRAAVRSPAAATSAEAAGLSTASLDEVLADPTIDLVVVATPTAGHAEHATCALEAGKHVVVEKPLAATSAQAARLADLARERGRLLSVFQNRRWDADFLSLQAVLESGAVGRLFEVTSAWDRFRPEVRDRWRERPGPGAGVWWDLGAHLVDQAVRLFGPPDDLLADIATQREGAAVDDGFHVRFCYRSGLRVVLESRSVALAPAPRFVVHGERGSWIKRGLDPQEAALKAGVRPGAPGWGDDREPGVLTLAGPDGPCTAAGPAAAGDYTRFYPQVRQAILQGAEPPVTADDAVLTLRLLERARESASYGRALAP